MSTNTEHIAKGQTELSAATSTNINRVQAALASEPDPETEGDFNDVVDEHYGADEENEFAAREGIKATIGGRTVIDMTAEDDLSAFNPDNFIAKAATIAAGMPAKKVDYIALRKPQATEYVRVTSDKKYRMSPVYLMDVKKGGKTVQYLIHGKCVGDVLSLVGGRVVKDYSISLAINNAGDPFLWYVREGAEDPWSESAVALQKRAISEWLRIQGNGNYYVGISPQDKLADPKWPTESFPQLLKLAFGNRVIDSTYHPAVKAILGVNS
jgi:hypothetical protein